MGDDGHDSGVTRGEFSDRFKQLLEHDDISLNPPDGAASRQRCNSCGVVFFASPFADYTGCPNCDGHNTVATMPVIDGE